jgi:hypothetical protein
LNTGALRRKLTVMPDIWFPPGEPAVLRHAKRHLGEQGTDVPRYRAAGEARPAVGHARAGGSRSARPQRNEPRWRDIRWVDFTGDSGDNFPAPESPPPQTSAPTPAEKPASAGLAPVLHGFAEPRRRPPGDRPGAIPGLAARFTRVPVAGLTAPRPDSVRFAPKETPVSARMPPALARLMPRPAPPAPSPPSAAAAGVRPALVSPTTPEASPAETLPPVAPPLALVAAAPKPASPPAQVLLPRVVAEPKPAATPATVTAPSAELIELAVVMAQKPAPAPKAEFPPKPTPPLRASEPPRAEPRLAAPEVAIDAEPAIIAEPLPSEAQAAPLPPLGSIFARLAQPVAGDARLRMALTIAAAAFAIAIVAYYVGTLFAGLISATPETKGAPGTGPHAASTSAVPAAHAATPAPQPATPPQPPTTPAPIPILPSDPAARAAFYLARAKAGDVAAQFDVGVLYARGEGLVQDFISAASWFHAAAAQGSIPAEYNLGVLYERGLGVAPSAIEALNWYRSAADRNHAGAQYNLALAYTEGRGTEQDMATAARWYQRAAQQGVAPAMVNLAILYERGSGVDRSLVDAYAWYGAAAEAGDVPAKQRAAEIYKQFSEQDKARAEGLAATIGATIRAPTPPA